MRQGACYLSGNVSVRSAVAINEVSVDIVAAWQSFKRLQLDPRVVIRYHISITVLELVLIRTRRVPGELLTRVNRLVLLGE